MSWRDKKPAKPSASRHRIIRTLDDLNRPSAHDSDSDSDDPPEYYTGGEKSGMVVQDPNKVNDVDEIFNQVRELGGLEGSMENDGPSSSTTFTGSGRLLSGEHVTAAPQQPQNFVHNIVFWRNGFSVDDGPLRRLDDPQNAPFLQSIKKSECPQELEPADRKSSIHVNLIRRDENHPEPIATQVAFHGIGRTLGRNSDESTPEQNTTNAPAPTPRGIVLDNSLPTTSIQLQLADGSRIIGQFNNHHTIADIRVFINSSRPHGSTVYRLQTVGFPPKELIDPNQTVDQAGLANSVVIQKT